MYQESIFVNKILYLHNVTIFLDILEMLLTLPPSLHALHALLLNVGKPVKKIGVRAEHGSF